MPRAVAALIALVTFIGADVFVVAHPKNVNAPLQPPAVNDVAARPASPSPSVRPTASPRGTPAPRITLQPGVRATEVPGVTYTHVS